MLPHEDLAQSIASIDQALAAFLAPTAVLTRSRSRGDATSPPDWLPDTFISQVWCNRAMMTGVGLDDEAYHRDSTLLQMLPKFIRAHRPGGAGTGSDEGPELIVVDGTSFVPSVFDLDGDGRQSTLGGNVAAADGGNLYFGTMNLALIRGGGADEDGNGDGEGVVSIGEAPWPPVYVLEHVATESGLVLVNNVNCGYLDFATNFLLAARKVSDAKVR